MHAGDIFSGKNIPILDGFNGGSGVDMPKTLSKAADYAAKQKIEAIITGHSTQMTIADLREYSAFNGDFLQAVKDAKKAGTAADALAASWKVPENTPVRGSAGVAPEEQYRGGAEGAEIGKFTAALRSAQKAGQRYGIQADS